MQPVQPESECRIATILFADISGFTSMSERLEPEDVTELMNACFEAIGSIAEGQGGVIDKYIGVNTGTVVAGWWQGRWQGRWNRAVAEAGRLGARVELAHTMRDAGELLGSEAPGPAWREQGSVLYRELGIAISMSQVRG